eukprot:m.6269 g.6269  ORF g.6269 m.6269 type:complete len:80 (+) comp4730_c0_seq1:132-371(+)
MSVSHARAQMLGSEIKEQSIKLGAFVDSSIDRLQKQELTKPEKRAQQQLEEKKKAEARMAEAIQTQECMDEVLDSLSSF